MPPKRKSSPPIDSLESKFKFDTSQSSPWFRFKRAPSSSTQEGDASRNPLKKTKTAAPSTPTNNGLSTISISPQSPILPSQCALHTKLLEWLSPSVLCRPVAWIQSTFGTGKDHVIQTACAGYPMLSLTPLNTFDCVKCFAPLNSQGEILQSVTKSKMSIAFNNMCIQWLSKKSLPTNTSAIIWLRDFDYLWWARHFDVKIIISSLEELIKSHVYVRIIVSSSTPAKTVHLKSMKNTTPGGWSIAPNLNRDDLDYLKEGFSTQSRMPLGSTSMASIKTIREFKLLEQYPFAFIHGTQNTSLHNTPGSIHRFVERCFQHSSPAELSELRNTYLHRTVLFDNAALLPHLFMTQYCSQSLICVGRPGVWSSGNVLIPPILDTMCHQLNEMWSKYTLLERLKPEQPNSSSMRETSKCFHQALHHAIFRFISTCSEAPMHTLGLKRQSSGTAGSIIGPKLQDWLTLPITHAQAASLEVNQGLKFASTFFGQRLSDRLHVLKMVRQAHFETITRAQETECAYTEWMDCIGLVQIVEPSNTKKTIENAQDKNNNIVNNTIEYGNDMYKSWTCIKNL